jgi:hypothetical protein
MTCGLAHRTDKGIDSAHERPRGLSHTAAGRQEDFHVLIGTGIGSVHSAAVTCGYVSTITRAASTAKRTRPIRGGIPGIAGLASGPRNPAYGRGSGVREALVRAHCGQPTNSPLLCTSRDLGPDSVGGPGYAGNRGADGRPPGASNARAHGKPQRRGHLQPSWRSRGPVKHNAIAGNVGIRQRERTGFITLLSQNRPRSHSTDETLLTVSDACTRPSTMTERDHHPAAVVDADQREPLRTLRDRIRGVPAAESGQQLPGTRLSSGKAGLRRELLDPRTGQPPWLTSRASIPRSPRSRPGSPADLETPTTSASTWLPGLTMHALRVS